MRVAVTGGAGFIGGHVVDQLLRVGHEPVIFDHRSKRHPVESEQGSGRFDAYIPTMLGDARDETAVTELAAHVDGIIHLASVLGTQETVFNPRPAVMTNVVAGMNVFEAGVQYGIPVVNICVGNHGMSNPYSASKTCVETLGQMYVRDRGLALNQVRVVNAYGPRQLMAAPFGPGKVRKIMPAFVARALTGAPIEVYGDGMQVSDCVYVEDVARALVRALEYAKADQVIPRVVEVGPSDHTTVRRVAELVQKSAERIGHPAPAPAIVELPMRPGETPGARVTADSSTMRMLGMDPDNLIDLESGIDQTVRWFAQHWLPDYKRRTAGRRG